MEGNFGRRASRAKSQIALADGRQGTQKNQAFNIVGPQEGRQK